MSLFFLVFACALLHAPHCLNGMAWNHGDFHGAQTYILTLKLQSAPAMKGYAMVAVFDGQDKFLTDDAVLKERISTAQLINGSLRLHLPQGRYAIAVYIDANNNGKLDRNMFRYPTELYGFSNNAKGDMGPPSFESAAFSLHGDMAMEIGLN